MERKTTRARSALKRPGKFLLRVLVGFQRNQGLLLSGAVAYYTLLSIVPMLALILVGLSHFVEEKQLYDTILTNLRLVIPQHAESVAGQVWEFFARRHLVGIFGIFFILFFSSLAFTVLENAMAVIFAHRARRHRRHVLISAVIPYAYIVLMGVGLLLVTLISGALGALSDKHIVLLGFDLSMEYTSRIALYFSGIFGMVAILTSLYLVMPVGQVSIRYALAGGVTATVLWELVRHILVWYYTNISLVNVIYGSLATAVVALLSIEIAVIILLFGAQVIAEFERSTIEIPQAGHADFDI